MLSRKLFFSTLAFAATFHCAASFATDASRHIVPAVFDPTGNHINPDTLFGGNWSGINQVTVTCYYPSDDKAICAGGGDFDKHACGSDDTNFGTVIKDQDSNCWYRKNFGLNGIVDARQCGVRGDGIDHSDLAAAKLDDADLLVNCMNIAADNGYYTVSTGGGVIVNNEIDLALPANVALTCGAKSFDAPGKADYRIFKNGSTGNLHLAGAIVLSPIVNPTTGTSPSVSLLNNGSGLSGCIIEAGTGGLGANGKFLNPYSPSVFDPDCDPSYGQTSQCVDLDSASVNETRASSFIQSAFSNPPHLTPGPAARSVGVSIKGGGVNIRDVRIVGFGTCITEQGPGPLTQNVKCDGGTGISIHTSDVPRIDDTTIGADVTTGEAGFKIESITWDNTHSLYRVSVDVVTTPADPGYNYRFADNDIVWIYPQPGKGAESSSGYWVTTDTACPTGTGPCTFDLLGSKKLVTLPATVNDSGYPALVISSMDPTNSDLKYVQIGQTVTDLTDGVCTSGGLSVVNVWPARGLVYLSGPLSCPMDSGQHSFQFADNTYIGAAGSCGLKNPAPPPPASNTGCAMVDPNFRWGDGVYVENSGGMRAVNCQVYEHLVSYHLYDGARTSSFSNCETGNGNDLPDRNLAALTSPTYPSGNIVSLLINGRHIHTAPPDDQTNETDACEAAGANMLLGQHRNIDVVVQSDCAASNRLANVSIGGGANGIDIEVDAGGVSLANSQGSSGSTIFKADAADLYSYDGSTYIKEGNYPANLSLGNNYLPGVPLVMANTAAAATAVGCGNTFAPPPALNCPGVLAVTTVTSSITLDGSSEF